MSAGGAGIKQQPPHAEPQGPVVTAVVEHVVDSGTAAASVFGNHVVHLLVDAVGAGIAEQRQLGEQLRSHRITALGQCLAGGQDGFQLGVAAIGRQQAGLQIKRPIRHRHDRIAGAGRDLRVEVEHHG